MSDIEILQLAIISTNKKRYNYHDESKAHREGFVEGFKSAMEINIDKELKRIMQADPVTFFLVNMSNYLTPEQMKTVSNKLVEWTTKSNGEVLQDAIIKVHQLNHK